MSWLRMRGWRTGDRFVLDPSLSIVLSLALIVAGCGGRAAHAPTADARVAAPPQSHTNSALVTPPAEMEADGLPVQRPPMLRRTRMPDDPREPFSPNYGAPMRQAASPGDNGSTANALLAHEDVRTVAQSAGGAVARISLRDLPEDLPPDFRERLIVQYGLQ